MSVFLTLEPLFSSLGLDVDIDTDHYRRDLAVHLKIKIMSVNESYIMTIEDIEDILDIEDIEDIYHRWTTHRHTHSYNGVISPSQNK